ncbi:hypothetical protein [Rhodobium gokarnense]|uniref:Uncharacterized protein n=1 Tax=Rhodobium gokarnense TaxID=364296 RepID=A0ABT3HCM0_9HYPH|nr:hypothetical protein [Rhodobium gokarnense]MCW2308026.1 hypothetical protein [Rhodobium gokarnense]
MTGDTPKKSDARAEREKRLADALRQNLRRRKAGPPADDARHPVDDDAQTPAEKPGGGG